MKIFRNFPYRAVFCSGVFLITGLWSLAGEQTFTVAAQSLDGWTLVGADSAKLATDTRLLLPSGAQLGRSFKTGDIRVEVVTQPHFSVDAVDWPVLEIGTTALILMREGSEGKIALLVGQDAPLILPGSVALDSNGNSQSPFALSIVQRAGSVAIEVLGKQLSFPVDAVSSIDVLASAGADSAWPLDRFSVTLPAANNALANDTDRAVGASRDLPSSPTKPRAGQETRGASNAEIENVSTDGATPAVVAVPATSSLEVFTPPAVRFGRAELLRSTVAHARIQ